LTLSDENGNNKIVSIRNFVDLVYSLCDEVEVVFMQYVDDGKTKRNIRDLDFFKDEESQLKTVESVGLLLYYITNPSEKVQLEAVRCDARAIQFVSSESIQLKALDESPYYGAEFIKNPSEAVQLYAVNKFGESIEYFPNPSECVQIAAVKDCSDNILYIKNPCEQAQLQAVQDDCHHVDRIHGHIFDSVRRLSERLDSRR